MDGELQISSTRALGLELIKNGRRMHARVQEKEKRECCERGAETNAHVFYPRVIRRGRVTRITFPRPHLCTTRMCCMCLRSIIAFARYEEHTYARVVKQNEEKLYIFRSQFICFSQNYCFIPHVLIALADMNRVYIFTLITHRSSSLDVNHGHGKVGRWRILRDFCESTKRLQQLRMRVRLRRDVINS